MENVILFGASKLGKIAYLMLKDKFNILYFCDNDKNKIGSKLNNIEIISLEELKKFDNKIKIYITSQYYKEISRQLVNLGITNFEKFALIINGEEEKIAIEEKLNIKEINLGKFLYDLNISIQLNNMVYMYGAGSSILDYAFLKGLIKKFGFSTYLEIGSFIGESMDVVSSGLKKCYSISLPDETLKSFFDEKGKINFGSYFLNNKLNVIQFKEDSKSFDYNIIKDKIDLVFIDGDHSYKGIATDTKNIFNLIDTENTIVVWHDFKFNGYFRMPTVNAIYDVLPKEFHPKIYAVDNNMCGVYIPDKYIDCFNFDKEHNILYSYETQLVTKINKK